MPANDACFLVLTDFHFSLLSPARAHTDPGSLRIDTVKTDEDYSSIAGGTRSVGLTARAAVHTVLPGVCFNHEGEPVATAVEFQAWVADDFRRLRERCDPNLHSFNIQICFRKIIILE